jgi:hypothetical protein
MMTSKKRTAPSALPRVIGVSAPFVRQHFVDKEGGEWQPVERSFDVSAILRACSLPGRGCWPAGARIGRAPR